MEKFSYRKKLYLNLFVIIIGFILFLLFEIIDLFVFLFFLGIIILFYVIDFLFNIKFKKRHYLFVIFVSFFVFLFGGLHFIYPYLNRVSHFIGPLLFASIVFYVVSKANLDKKYTFLIVFFVVIGFLAIFEIGEYFLDFLFNTRTQGTFIVNSSISGGYEMLADRHDDTMIDLILGSFGALLYVLVGFFSINKRNN